MSFPVMSCSMAKKYTKDTALGLGALKGAAAQIERIEEIEGGHEHFYKWEDNEGYVHRKSMRVMDGVTPLHYIGTPGIGERPVLTGMEFDISIDLFNRPPKDGEQFFLFITASDGDGDCLCACAAEFIGGTTRAKLVNHMVVPFGGAADVNPGSVRYKHIQDTESDTWDIQHNLTFQNPTVVCTNGDGDTIYGNISYETQNKLKIHFSEPVEGTAFISK